MRTLDTVVSNPSGWDSSANYVGQSKFPGVYVVLTRTRDSDELEESNFETALSRLGGEDEENGVIIYRFGHWACGWWEALTVTETSPFFAAAGEIAKQLDNLDSKIPWYVPVYSGADLRRMAAKQRRKYARELREMKGRNCWPKWNVRGCVCKVCMKNFPHY